MLAYKNAKICVTPTQTLKFALPPTQIPNASRWNIGDVGSLGVGSRVDYVHFMLFVSLSLALGSQHEHNFQWNMGFTQLKTLQVHSSSTGDSYFLLRVHNH